MTDGDISALGESFRIDPSATAPEVARALADLASAVRVLAAGSDEGLPDAAEDLLGELENITVDEDSTCVRCGGDGMVDCGGNSGVGACPGDETCSACEGEAATACPACGGSGENLEPTVSDEAIAGVVQAVRDAFGRFVA